MRQLYKRTGYLYSHGLAILPLRAVRRRPLVSAISAAPRSTLPGLFITAVAADHAGSRFRKGILRIWDVDPSLLCRAHLLGEHRELHGLWNVLTLGKDGYSRHPETRRWVGKLAALFERHDQLVVEMMRRGYAHGSPLDGELAVGSSVQDAYVDSPEKQLEILREKPCDCPLNLTP